LDFFLNSENALKSGQRNFAEKNKILNEHFFK